MKQLLSIICCVMYLQCISSPVDIAVSSPKTSGEKVLVKALTAIVNREGNKKTPVRRMNETLFEYP